MKVYVTKFALEKGCIIEGELAETMNVTNDWTRKSETKYLVYTACGEYLLNRNDFEDSKVTATIVAENKRIEKIKELESQIDRLMRMNFT